MKGEKFLKVTGVIMVICGILGAILYVIALTGVALTVQLGLLSGQIINGGLLTFALIVSVVLSITEMVAGFMGFKNSDRPEKANSCLKVGIAVIALYLISVVLTLVSGGDFNFFYLILDLIVPGLYVFGAYQNKKTIQ